jgi:hypothetical protein
MLFLLLQWLHVHFDIPLNLSRILNFFFFFDLPGIFLKIADIVPRLGLVKSYEWVIAWAQTGRPILLSEVKWHSNIIMVGEVVNGYERLSINLMFKS